MLGRKALVVRSVKVNLNSCKFPLLYLTIAVLVISMDRVLSTFRFCYVRKCQFLPLEHSNNNRQTNKQEP